MSDLPTNEPAHQVLVTETRPVEALTAAEIAALGANVRATLLANLVDPQDCEDDDQVTRLTTSDKASLVRVVTGTGSTVMMTTADGQTWTFDGTTGKVVSSPPEATQAVSA